MDNVERAKELFLALERGKIVSATEIARRAFYIQQKLSEMSG